MEPCNKWTKETTFQKQKNDEFIDEDEEWGAEYEYVSAHEMNSVEYNDYQKETGLNNETNKIENDFSKLQSNFILTKFS